MRTSRDIEDLSVSDRRALTALVTHLEQTSGKGTEDYLGRLNPDFRDLVACWVEWQGEYTKIVLRILREEKPQKLLAPTRPKDEALRDILHRLSKRQRIRDAVEIIISLDYREQCYLRDWLHGHRNKLALIKAGIRNINKKKRRDK